MNTSAYKGDPGLFGPDSITWKVMGDVSSFIGGIRALIIQAAHPEVAAGVGDHSTYRDDPLGRLSRTASYVTATSYGSMPEVKEAITTVRQVHTHVKGLSHRGLNYSASNPKMAAWVHNALTDSFLTSYQNFGPSPLTSAEENTYVKEQNRLGELMGASPLPETAVDLQNWLKDHPDLENSPAGKEAIAFLAKAPLHQPVATAYRILYAAAASTIPEPLCRPVEINPSPYARISGRIMIAILRTALGASPAWAAALDRNGITRPTNTRFRSTRGTIH